MGLVYNTMMVVVVVSIVAWTWRVMNWLLLRPLKLQRCLIKQGLGGNSYRFFSGDTNESLSMEMEARSTPIHISDDIAPRVIPFIHHTIKTYGERSFTWFGPTPRINIMDPEMIKQVLTKTSKFPKPKQNPFVRLFINGVSNREGDEWAKRRKLLNPAFHIQKLKYMLPAMDVSCSEMIRQWESMILADGTCELDVWPYLQTFTKDVISRTAFGSSYQQGSMVFELQKQQVEHAINYMNSTYIPGWRYVRTKRSKMMKEIDRRMQSSLREIIDKKMMAIKAGEASTDDLLGLILLESNSSELRHGNRSGGMSIEEVMGECKLFYFAGQETTAVLLVWTMVLLSIHPDWQQRARQEVFQVFGKNRKPEFDSLSYLKIVTMILYEVLRLYPPVPTTQRVINEKTQLGDITLPAGAQVMLPVILVHRDPQIWGKDAKEFKPQRFSEGVSRATKNKMAFFPFGWGPRICIGQNFAMMEAKLAVAAILQRFSFELSPTYTHAPITALINRPQYGANLILHKLNYY